MSGENSDCEEDTERTSRLFYLQLYSDVLNAEKHDRRESYKRKIKQVYVKTRKSKVNVTIEAHLFLDVFSKYLENIKYRVYRVYKLHT